MTKEEKTVLEITWNGDQSKRKARGRWQIEGKGESGGKIVGVLLMRVVSDEQINRVKVTWFVCLHLVKTIPEKTVKYYKKGHENLIANNRAERKNK